VSKTRALLVDAEPDFRVRLRAALSAHVEVVGEVDDAAEGAAFVAAEPVDLVVLSLPRAEDFEAAQELFAGDPDLVLVVLNRSRADAPPAAGASELHGLAKLLVALGAPARAG
jgi:DNA-binding NarL/FixJ family response regulator